MQPFYVIKSLVFVLPIIAAAYLYRGLRVSDTRFEDKCFFIYFAIAGLIFTLTVGLPLFLLTALAVLLLAPREPDLRAAFFLPALLAFPSKITYSIPFPGINYLFEIDGVLLMTIVLLLPLLLKPAVERALPTAGRGVDLFFYSYTTAVLLLSLRDFTTITDTLRQILVFVLGNYVLYGVLSRHLGTKDGIRAAIAGIFIAGLLFVGVGTLSAAKQWYLYGPIVDFSYVNLSRGDSMRLRGPYDVFYASYIGAAMVMMFWMLRGRFKAPKFVAYGGVLLSMYCVLQTGQRGAIVALATMIGVLVYLNIPAKGLRVAAMTAAFAAATAAVPWLLKADLSGVDKYGSFAYRQRLIQMASEKFSRHPIIGDAAYRDDPFFEPLRQGQGIIDFVNGYVHIALSTGAVGMLLFAGLLVASFRVVLKSISHLSEREDADAAELVLYGRTIVVLMAGIVTMSGLTSFRGYLFPSVLIFAALSKAYAVVAARELLRGPATQAEAEPDKPRMAGRRAAYA